MKRLLLSYGLLLGVSPLSASGAEITFQRTFGGAGSDISYSIQQTYDSGYIIAGYTLSFGQGSRDVYLIRTDVNGVATWTRTYGSFNTDYAWTVAQTADSGFIVGSHSGSFGAGSHDIYLLKVDNLGGVLWERTYGGSSADGVYSLVNTFDGGFMISAHTSSFGQGQHDVYLLKLDSIGDTAWTRTYGGSGGDYLRSVIQTTDGGFICVSETFSFGAGSADVYIVRIDSAGNLLWAKAYGGSSADYGYSILQSADGGFVVSGYTSSFGAGQFDVYLLKTDSAGDTLWAKTYGGALSDYGYSLCHAPDGGFLIAGYTQSFGAGGDVYLIRVDSAGNHLWSRTFGGAGIDYGWSVQPTFDSGYVISGYTSSFGAGSNDVYLIKTDALGNSGCNQTDPSTVSNSASPTLIATTQTFTGSGSQLSNPTAFVGIPETLDKLICSDAGCLPCLAGDADDGGEVNIGDATFIVKYVFQNGDVPPCLDQANADGGVDVNIGDATYIVKFIFQNGDPPVCVTTGS